METLPELLGLNIGGTTCSASIGTTDGEILRLEIQSIHAAAVGDAVALLVDLLGADRILLGSASRYLGEHWVDMVRKRARHQAGYWTRFEVAPPSLGERLQDCSALAAAYRAWRPNRE